MTSKVLRALKASIAHWKRMRDDPECGDTPSGLECPLCNLFDGPLCGRCPVKRRTGFTGCHGTPWMYANAAFDHRHDSRYCLDWTNAATAEIKFLESLLPPVKKRAKKKVKGRKHE